MLPLHLQPQSHVPLYIQLRDQLRALVHAGDLRPGDRIPASRELATMLGVHRTTVANAYAELESEGLIQGHVGRGTFIKPNGHGLKITPPAPPVLNGGQGIRWELLFADERGEEILSRLTASAPEDALSFVMARPAQEFFPVEELQTCVNAVLRREAAEVLNLGPSDGYPPLKEALLEMLHRDGIAGKDENLLITDGCQQSFDLISKAFVRPGDSVIMENPTYPGAVSRRADENACRARDSAGAGCGGAGGDAGGESRQADRANPGLPESNRNFDATSIAAQGFGIGRTVPGCGGGRSYLRTAACARGTHPLTEAARPAEPGDPHRQLRESGVSRTASRMDRGSGNGDRAAARGETDDGSAHGSTGASHAGGIFAARTFQQAPCEDAQDLHLAPRGAGRSAAEAHARRNALDAAGRWHVPVAGTPARIRRQRIADSCERTRRAVRAGAILLRAGTAPEHPAAWLRQPG